MRFLKLLDPRGLTLEGPGLTHAEQGRKAREMFPLLVKESRLSYWRPGDAIASRGTRFLIGLAATFSLIDLRLADILNEALASRVRDGLVIDVFDIDDLAQGRLVPLYFPGSGLKTIAATPVLGIWESGVPQRVLIAGTATNFLLQYFKIGQTAQELRKSVCPPSASLLGD